MSRDLPNIGLKGGYTIGEDDWGDEQNANLLKLSTLVQGGVTGIMAAVPGAPTAGQVVILDATNVEHPNNVAVWDGAVGEEAWTYYEPNAGWLLWDNAQGAYVSFDGTTWAVLETGGGGGGGGIEDAPADGNIYGRKDNAWEEIAGGEGESIFGVVNLVAGTVLKKKGCTIKINSATRFSVVFDRPRADANYAVLFGGIDAGSAFGDIPFMINVATVNGFTVVNHTNTSNERASPRVSFLVVDEKTGSGGGNGGSLELIGETTLAADGNLILFDGISDEYVSLEMELVGQLVSTTTNNVFMTLNNVSTGGKYDYRMEHRFGSDAGNDVDRFVFQLTRSGQSASKASTGFIRIPNPQGVGLKAVRIESVVKVGNTGTDLVNMVMMGEFDAAARISQIKLQGEAPFVAGTKARLYGRKVASGGGGSGGVNPQAPWTKPVSTDFTALNLGTMVVEDSPVGLVLNCPSGNGFAARGIYKPVPAAPWNIYCRADLSFQAGEDNSRTGILIRDSVSGKVMSFGFQNNANSRRYVSIERWNNPTYFVGSNAVRDMVVTEVWLRLENDGTNLNFYVGNGYKWRRVYTTTIAAFIGSIDGAGFLLQSSYDSLITINSFSFTAPV